MGRGRVSRRSGAASQRLSIVLMCVHRFTIPHHSEIVTTYSRFETGALSPYPMVANVTMAQRVEGEESACERASLWYLRAI